jgi:hypothetical protein
MFIVRDKSRDEYTCAEARDTNEQKTKFKVANIATTARLVIMGYLAQHRLSDLKLNTAIRKPFEQRYPKGCLTQMR